MKNLTSSIAAAFFPLLESLSLKDLEKLEETWDGPIPSNCFNELKKLKLYLLPALKQLGKSSSTVFPLFTNLSSLNIHWCMRLRNVFSSATKDCLLQLQSIQIENCDEMEQLALVGNEEDDGNDVRQQSRIILIFPKLKSLHLKFLNLTHICKGIDSIQFPVLADIRIISCESMKCFVVSSSDDDEKEHHYGENDSLHLFCQPKVSFGNLKKLFVGWLTNESNKAWCEKVPSSFFNGLQKLKIYNYEKIRSLFSSSIAQNLANLQKLNIYACREMVKVIEEDKEEEKDDVCSDDHHLSTTKHTTLFPKLESLELWKQSKLKSFCEWRSCASLELPSLERLRIYKCPEMKSFVSGGSLIITPALQSIKINGEDFESGVKDLNAALHQHFEDSKEKGEVTVEKRNS